MSLYVVIGTAPTVDTSIVVGPFRTPDRAQEVAETVTSRGYVTEIARCQPETEIDYVDWSAP